MDKLLTPQTFEFFAQYVLAGFIIISVRSRFVVGERPQPSEVLVEAIVLSLINQLIFILTGSLIGWLTHAGSVTLPAELFLLLEVLVQPALLGILFGRNLSKGWSLAVLRRLSMPIEHPIRRAYDYAFTHDRSPGFVILTYEDGTKIYGYFGENSLAANDRQRSDIYLERLYEVDDENQWVENDVGRSALISLNGIRSIEFLENERGE